MSLETILNITLSDVKKEVDTKLCYKCGTVKPLSEFHKHKHQPHGVQFHCKVCRNGGIGDSTAGKKLMKKLGMTRPDLGTACEICDRTDKALVFDHCHKTQKFRGWLCPACNLNIGKLGDDIKSITKLVKLYIKYLRKFEKNV